MEYPNHLQTEKAFGTYAFENIPDKMITGLKKIHDQITPSHPLETANYIRKQDEENPFTNLSMGLKLKLRMEKKAVEKISPLSCLAPCNPSLSTLMENYNTIDFTDMLNSNYIMINLVST
ncbi:unnamed protein product [Gordionus sp. m RMFG-2023]